MSSVAIQLFTASQNYTLLAIPFFVLASAFMSTGGVAKRIIRYVEETQPELVETLAENIASIVMNEFNVPWLRLTLGKPGAVRRSREVGIVIERGSRD